MYYVTTKGRGAEQVRIIEVVAKREAARAIAKEQGAQATVRTEAEVEELRKAGRIFGAKASLLELAKDIVQTAKVRKTLSSKVARQPKRVSTPPAVLTEAAVYLATGVKSNVNKVTIVRGLALWTAADGTRLQRKDLFTLIRASEQRRGIQPSDEKSIADHTISTQYQRVRGPSA